MKSKFMFILFLVIILLYCFSAVSASDDFNDTVIFSDNCAVDEVACEIDFFDEAISLENNMSLGVADDSSNEMYANEKQQNNGDCEQFGDLISRHASEISVYKNISYFKDKTNLEGHIMDDYNHPLQNKTLNIKINNKIYESISNNEGKFSLAVDLKPNTYNVKIAFGGDDVYSPSTLTTTLKIKKAPVSLKINNFNTYFGSDIFFNVKILNSKTKMALKDIKVQFKVYNTKTKKYSYYVSKTDKNGIAKLKKNLKAGTYKVSAKITSKEVSYKSSAKKVTMNVLPTKEKGCCSFYVQVSGSEAVAGFRRDGTEAVNILIKSAKIGGKSAVKQYKTTYGYFFHTVTTADGWMFGNGGIEDGSVCKAIEKIAAGMVKSKSIKTSELKKILKYKKRMGFGHFSIKAPNGKYAIVYHTGYVTGKLKAGEFLSIPNFKSCFRHGTYAKYGSDPVKVGIKVGATDPYGVNRRDVTVFHWKATTDKNYKTTAVVKCYGANDNGKLVGRSTAYLKDNIYFKNKLFSKNKLPKTPNYVFLGSHSFGNIDKLIKTPTTVSAPEVHYHFNQSKYFKVTVKNKSTKKVIAGTNIKIKISGVNFTKYYTVKTDSKGIAKLNTNVLDAGNYTVAVTPANNKYLISAKSKIEII